jgi:hypothetical protein
VCVCVCVCVCVRVCERERVTNTTLVVAPATPTAMRGHVAREQAQTAPVHCATTATQPGSTRRTRPGCSHDSAARVCALLLQPCCCLLWRLL